MYIKKLSAQAIAILSIGSLCITSAGCNGKTKPAPIPPTEVNAALEMNPPIARSVEVQFKPDDPNGNLFVVADFGQGTIKGEFHAIMAGEEKVVLRDDGLGGDGTKGDGVFTAALSEDMDATAEHLRGISTGMKALISRPTFVGRERVARDTSLSRMVPFDRAAFVSGAKFPLIPAALCEPVTDVSIEHSLMVTNVGVVEDPTRTSQPCTRPDATGAWTFGKLMTDMANTASTGVSGEEFVKNWLKSWLAPTVVNGDPLPARTNLFNLVIRPWVIASGSAPGSFTIADWDTKPLDLGKAPFKLTAIVNRLDLRGNSGYTISNAGEGRFVFGTLNGTCAPTSFTVIFEYGVPIKKCRRLVDYARQWYDLRTHAIGSAAYNAALQAVTDVFAAANAVPAKPNGSAINQIRTNEIALDSPWELREFNVDATTHQLFLTTVKQEPAKKYNAMAAPPVLPSDVTVMADWVNANATDIISDRHTVPLDIGGVPFLGGKSHTLSGGFWNAASGQILDPEARHHFSLNTCSGCHGRETRTDFLQVGTPPFGTAAVLAGFLIGITVNDPVSGTSRTFADLERRKDDLAKLMCRCKGRRLFDLAHVLTFKPIHMTH